MGKNVKFKCVGQLRPRGGINNSSNQQNAYNNRSSLLLADQREEGSMPHRAKGAWGTVQDTDTQPVGGEQERERGTCGLKSFLWFRALPMQVFHGEF